jgi:hypothetical protein
MKLLVAYRFDAGFHDDFPEASQAVARRVVHADAVEVEVESADASATGAPSDPRIEDFGASPLTALTVSVSATRVVAGRQDLDEL